MAESYRGLTIRIGGDTSELAKALKTANEAASQTQSELRKLNQAVKLDPTNLEAFNMQMGYVAHQASNTAMKLYELKDAQKQLEDKNYKIRVTYEDDENGGFRSVKESLSDIIEKAKRADGLTKDEILNSEQHLAIAHAGLRKVIDSLSSAHTEVSNIVAAVAKVEENKLKEALTFAMNGGNEDALRKSIEATFKTLPNGVKRSKEELDEIFEKVRQIGSELSVAIDIDSGTVDTAMIEDILRKFSEDLPTGVRVTDGVIEDFANSITAAMNQSSEAVEKSKSKLNGLHDKAVEAKQTYDELSKSVESTFNKATADAEAEYNSELEKTRKNLEEKIALAEGTADASELIKKAQQEVTAAEEEYSESLKEQARLQQSLQNLEAKKSEIETTESIEAENAALAKLETNAQKTREELKKLFEVSRSEVTTGDVELGEDYDKQFDLVGRLEAEQQALKDAYTEAFAKAESESGEAKEKLISDAEEYKSKYVAVSAELAAASARRSEMEVEYEVEALRKRVANAQRLRESFEKLYFLTGETETEDGSLTGAINAEIEAQKALKKKLYSIYAEMITELKDRLKEADEIGDEGLKNAINNEIKRLEEAKADVVKEQTNSVARLERELKDFTSVEKASVDGASPIESIKLIGQELDDLKSKRDEEQRKIDETTTKLRVAGKTQKEIREETAESTAEVKRLNKEIERYEKRLDTLKKAGGGQNFKQAYSTSENLYNEDEKQVSDARADAAEEIAHRVEDAEEEIVAARKKTEEAAEQVAAKEKARVAAQENLAATKKNVADGDKDVATVAVESAARVEAAENKKKKAIAAANEAHEAGLKSVKAAQEQSEKASKKYYSAMAEQARDFMSSFNQNFNGLTSEVFNFNSGNTDPAHMQQVMEEIADALGSVGPAFGLTQQNIDAIIGDMKRLSEAFIQADTDVKKWKVVNKFQDLLVEIQNGESKLTDFSRVLSNLRLPSELSRGVQELIANASVLKEAYKSLMSSGSFSEGMYKADPSDVSSLTAAMTAYSMAEMVAIENMSVLQRKLDEYDTRGVDVASNDVRSVAQELFDASKAAEEAQDKLAKYNGEIGALEKRIAEIENTRRKSITDPEVEETYKDLKEKQASYEARKKELEAERELAQVEARRADKKLDLAKEKQEYVELSGEIEEYRKAIMDAYDAQLRMSQQDSIKSAFGDTSNIDNLGTQLNAAVERANALKEAVKLDPTNAELVAAKTKALADVQTLVKQRTESIKAAMSSFDASKLESIRSKYGTISNAVQATIAATKAYKMQLDTATSALSNLVKDSKFDNIRDLILDVGQKINSSITDRLGDAAEEVVYLRNVIATLKTAFAEAGDEMNYAAQLSQLEALETTMANTFKSGHMDTALRDQAAFMQSVQEMGQLARQAAQHIVDSANTIDEAYRNMRKTVNATEDQFENLRQAALDYSQTHITSADTILEMQALGGQLGVSADALQEFGVVASNLDIATDIDAEEIALKLGQITNVMSDLDESTFDNFADALVRLGNNTAAQESTIMNVAQRMSSVANVAQMGTPELLAWSAAIASTGQRSESAATAVNNTITGIAAAVSQGGDDLQNFASIAGMTADDFVAAWNNTPSDALEAFIKGLQSLSDSNTGAIQALENMGISSVRQETALLGLASTVETLDESLLMSRNAFNGVSDQWGNAGDAAVEAQRKSEGFSGALGIMQNNLTNLAAAMGDGLVMPMQIAAGALQVLTDAVNALPGPLKTVLITVGGLGAAFGAAYPVLKTFIDGWKELAANNNASQVIAAFSGVLGKLKDALGLTAYEAAFTSASLGETAVAAGAASGSMSLAAGAAKLLSGALKMIPELAVIGGIIAVFTTLTGVIGEAYDRMNLLNEAATVTKPTVSALGDAYSETVTKMNGVVATESLEEMKTKTNELIQSFVEFGEKINSTWENVGTNEAMADKYAEQIKTLGNQGSITSENMAVLKNAIEQYNSLTGSSISVINEQTGALNLNGQQIDEVTDAYKRMAEAKAYADLYNETVKQQVETEQELTEATEELEAMKKKYGISLGEVGTLMVWNTNEARELQERIDALNAEVARNNARMDEYSQHLNMAAGDTMSYESAMASAGMEASNFGDLTDDEKRKIAEIQTALIAAGDTLSNYGSLNASELAKIAAAWHGSTTGIIKYIKDLKNAQAAADAEEASVDYEAVAAARKKELESIYDDEKKRRDRAYTQEQNDLNKQYSEAQKQSQKYLKDYKANLDAEVDAFKEATDAKLEEIEKEYDAKQKLLDQEYEGYDSDIDKKIADIEAEQEAEDAARKKKEREEKLAELNEKVATATTNKARKEAQKELQDYIDDLTAEDIKSQRDAQIQKLKDQQAALKEQKSERDKELKDSYDNAVNTYKAAREAELKILQETNEAKYESEQEAQQAMLESLKESNDARLQEIKYQNEDELAAMKEAIEYEVEQIKQGNVETAKDTAKTIDDIANTSALSMAEAAKMLVEVGTDPVKRMAVLNRIFASEAANAAANGYSDENAIGYITLAAQRLVEAGTDPIKQMQVLNETFGANSSWALANGMSSDEATTLLNTVANALVLAGTDPLKQMEVLNTAYGSNASNAALMGFEAGVSNEDLATSASYKVKAMTDPFGAMGDALKVQMANAIMKGVEGMDNASPEALNQAATFANRLLKNVDITDNAKVIGNNIIAGINNGSFGSSLAQNVLSNYATFANNVNTTLRKAFGINSPSKVAIEIMEYYNKGLLIGAGHGQDAVVGKMESLSDSITKAMDLPELNLDITSQLIEDMHSKEQALLEQSKRMAEIVERGFDPQLTVAAAYEAMDAIDAGTFRRQQAIASSQQQNYDNRQFSINISIPEVVVREDADIDKLSQQIALRVQRTLNARIG